MPTPNDRLNEFDLVPEQEALADAFGAFSVRVSEAISEASDKPPYCNTGVETPNGKFTALIDWFEVTYHTEDVELVKSLWGSDWTMCDVGGDGYKKQCMRGNVRVYWDGNEGMGVHVKLSGKGCRQVEDEKIVTNWVDAMRGVLDWEGANFTRLDVALDEREGLVDVAECERLLRDQCVVSKFEKCRPGGDVNIKLGKIVDGMSLTFGAATSSLRVRIYDKGAEQGTFDQWTRVEVQARGGDSPRKSVEKPNQSAKPGKAMNLARAIVALGDVSAAVGVLRNSLDFKQKGTGDVEHRYRWKTCDWWDKVLGLWEKLSLWTAPAGRTILDCQNWLEDQVAPTMAMLYDYYGGNMRHFVRIVKMGKKRMGPRHDGILSAARISSVPVQRAWLSIT